MRGSVARRVPVLSGGIESLTHPLTRSMCRFRRRASSAPECGRELDLVPNPWPRTICADRIRLRLVDIASAAVGGGARARWRVLTLWNLAGPATSCEGLSLDGPRSCLEGPSYSLTHALTHSRTHSLTHSLSLTLTLTHSHSLSLSLSPAPSL